MAGNVQLRAAPADSKGLPVLILAMKSIFFAAGLKCLTSSLPAAAVSCKSQLIQHRIRGNGKETDKRTGHPSQHLDIVSDR
jgi:hypothetical protein